MTTRKLLAARLGWRADAAEVRTVHRDRAKCDRKETRAVIENPSRVPILHDFAVLLAAAQPAPTPDALEVTLVDEGKEWWKDYVVPAATLTAALVGGVGGVVIGGRMSRATMRTLEKERAEREDARDLAQSEREDQREAARTQRELAAQRRLALGSLRLAIDDINLARMDLELEANSRHDNPAMTPDVESRPRVRPEDKHAIAMWVSDRTWEIISLTLAKLEFLIGRRAEAREAIANGEISAGDYRAEAASQAETLRSTLETLEPELGLLAGDSDLQAIRPPSVDVQSGGSSATDP